MQLYDLDRLFGDRLVAAGLSLSSGSLWRLVRLPIARLRTARQYSHRTRRKQGANRSTPTTLSTATSDYQTHSSDRFGDRNRSFCGLWPQVNRRSQLSESLEKCPNLGLGVDLNASMTDRFPSKQLQLGNINIIPQIDLMVSEIATRERVRATVSADDLASDRERIED